MIWLQYRERHGFGIWLSLFIVLFPRGSAALVDQIQLFFLSICVSPLKVVMLQFLVWRETDCKSFPFFINFSHSRSYRDRWGERCMHACSCPHSHCNILFFFVCVSYNTIFFLFTLRADFVFNNSCAGEVIMDLKLSILIQGKLYFLCIDEFILSRVVRKRKIKMHFRC